jgi:phosphoribosylformylglycinamidine synthase subunit PurS
MLQDAVVAAGAPNVTGQVTIIRIRPHLHQNPEVVVQLYRVPVQIIPRPGILDPQGAAVAGALRTLGFDNISDIRVGRFITVDVNAADPAAATSAVRSMCEKLLANPVIEDFVLEEPTLQQGAQS